MSSYDASSGSVSSIRRTSSFGMSRAMIIASSAILIHSQEPRTQPHLLPLDDSLGLARGDNERVKSTTEDDDCPMNEVVDLSTTTIEEEVVKRKRAECMAHMQSYTVRLALDLLVREPDLDGFFR